MYKSSGILIFLLAALLISGCMKSGDLKIKKNITPQQLDDGWTTATPESVGLNSALLNQAVDMLFDEDLYPTSKSLLVIKDNKLVLESYCRDLADRDRLSNIKSVTKSVTSILFGIAIDKGFFEPDLNRTVYSYLPQYFDSVNLKRSITLYHMLTMRTGLKWHDKEHTPDLFNTSRFPSSLRIVLQKSMEFPPGRWFNDNEGTSQIISGMITDTTGISLEEFAVENLFSKIGISNFYWEKHTDGLNYGAIGLYLNSRDMAKIGQLMARNGIWNSEQVVSSDWLNSSTSVQLSEAYTLFEPIGFYWWIRPDNNAFCAIGQGGQFIYVVPSKNLVIVHTAFPYSGSGYRGVTLKDFEEIVTLIIQAAG